MKKESQRRGPTLEMIYEQHQRLVLCLGFDVDLMERAIGALRFLHQEAYGSAPKTRQASEHCPVCQSTLPDLECVLERLLMIQAAQPRHE